MSADQPPTRTEAQSGHARPITADELNTDRFYGVPVSPLGEGGEFGYVAVTPDRRRAVAAVSACIRANGDRPSNGADVGELTYVRAFDHCGCGPHEVDEDEGHTDCDCPHWGLLPCRDEIYAWVQEKCTPDAENALPTYKIEVDLR